MSSKRVFIYRKIANKLVFLLLHTRRIHPLLVLTNIGISVKILDNPA